MLCCKIARSQFTLHLLRDPGQLRHLSASVPACVKVASHRTCSRCSLHVHSPSLGE